MSKRDDGCQDCNELEIRASQLITGEVVCQTCPLLLEQDLADDVMRRKGNLGRSMRLAEISREFGIETEARVRDRIRRMQIIFAGVA